MTVDTEAVTRPTRETLLQEAEDRALELWERRFDFVNAILVAGICHGDLELENVEFDGVAGKQFSLALRRANNCSGQINTYIGLALKLGVPVKGLEADGSFGPKWGEVVGLCKNPQRRTNLYEDIERVG